jgi:hypothetical protein
MGVACIGINMTLLFVISALAHGVAALAHFIPAISPAIVPPYLPIPVGP